MNPLNHKCVFSTSLHEYIGRIASFFKCVLLIQIYGKAFNVFFFHKSFTRIFFSNGKKIKAKSDPIHG